LDKLLVVEMPMLTTAAGRFCYFHTNKTDIVVAPTITEVYSDFYYPGTTTAQPYTDFTDTSATSYSWILNRSGTSTSKTIFTASGSGTPTGTDNITYTGSTIVNYWYWYIVTVTNSVGSASYTTARKQNQYIPA
jgi:hypothetical protein